MEERLLSVTEAAFRLGVSKHTINCWVSQGRITYVKLGRRTLFNPADLDAFIQSNTIPPRRGRPDPHQAHVVAA